jgi:hypothetical protein
MMPRELRGTIGMLSITEKIIGIREYALKQ